MDLTYTIRDFDDVNKTITVDYDDGSWASIRLVKPLPKNKTELEGIIKQFAKPIESIDAQTNPDADLGYISSLVGISNTCTRFSINQPAEATNIDPETEANLAMWEQVQFEKKVGDALVKLGVVATNPATIPITNA